MAHRHILGMSGSGKSTLMKGWVVEAIHQGHAVCYIDPHGTDTDDLLQYIPPKRRKDVIVFDPTQFPISWNPLETDNPALTASSFVDTIRITSGYSNTPTPRIDALIYNGVYALCEARHGLFGLYLMLVSDRYRARVLEAVSNPVVLSFWQWYADLSDKKREEFTESTFTKIEMLVADPRIMAVLGSENRLHFPTVVANQILFLRLPQGELGVGKSALVGSLMLAQLHQHLLARDQAVPFELFIDEAHNFAPSSLVEMLSGIRKSGVTLTLCHQYLSQLDPLLRSSLKANADAYVFRTSYEDARFFPELGDNAMQPYELPPYSYWHFCSETKPTKFNSEPWDLAPYPASARQVVAHVKRNLVSPATKENAKLMKNYLDGSA